MGKCYSLVKVYTSKGHKVIPNRYLCANICMIWSATTEGEYKHDHMNSTQLESHEKMVVVGQHDTIINQSGKSSDVRPLSSAFPSWKQFQSLILW